ncbi:MAG: hypothetical protein J6R04_08435, partial [Clostridia bacterium]|nr:hypothetical protein [Clostridia bacterium]
MELPKRRSPRLKGYDYSRNGAYFVTICTYKRKKMLSSIVGEGSPLPQLTVAGMIAKKWIECIDQKYPTVLPKYYVIMPNHIHLLLH